MLDVYVVDQNAEERLALVEHLYSLLDGNQSQLSLLPKVQFIPLSPEELKHRQEVRGCIVGSGMIQKEMQFVSTLRDNFPNMSLIAWLTPNLETISILDQLARMGVEDFLSSTAKPIDLLKKLLLLNQRRESSSRSSLIVVDSGKGGVGTTSITAAVGELLASQGKKTLLVDFDVESHDLSRFLNVRPHVNEPLQHILDGSRPVTGEFVRQTYSQVWEDDSNLYCMPAPPESDGFWIHAESYGRILYSLFEQLSDQFELIVVDLGGIQGPLHSVLLRIADASIFVLNDDPSSIMGSVNRLRKDLYFLSKKARMAIVHNSCRDKQLKSSTLRREVTRLLKLPEQAWIESPFPFSTSTLHWPGSGQTPFSLTKKAGRKTLESALEVLDVVSSQVPSRKSGLFRARLEAEPSPNRISSPERLQITETLQEKEPRPQRSLPAPTESIRQPLPGNSLTKDLVNSLVEPPTIIGVEDSTVS